MELEPKKIVGEILLPILRKLYAGHDNAVNYKLPEQLKREIDFSLPIQTASIDLKDVKQILENVIEFTPSAQHPFLFNYLYSKPDLVGVLGDWIVSLINSNVHTYEASPVFTLAEIELVNTLADIVGFKTGADGIFCPGGSYSNMMAMYLARNRCLENENVENKELVIFISEQSHYSIDKAASLLGIKRKNIHRVSCDNKGRMKVTSLRRHIENCLSADKQPMCVCATSGTTVLGGFDPLYEISEALLDYGQIWFHVDAAWGGAVLMSARHRHLMKGIEGADSITWDFHKALNAPILCSVLLVKSAIFLKSMFDVYDSYLFHDSEQSHQYDLGHKTAQCGRRGDAFKFWLMWKVRGRSHFERRVDMSFRVTSMAIKLIKERKAFWLYDENPDYWNVCFYFVPEHLRERKGIEACSQFEKMEVQRTTENLYRCLNKDGQVLVNYAEIDSGPPFIRLVFGNPDLNGEQMERVIDVIESIGNVITCSLQELLTSGGGKRLKSGGNGFNYTKIAPSPDQGLVFRASSTSSRITSTGFQRLTGLINDVRTCKLAFSDCMNMVHSRIRKIMEIDETHSIITTPSGTDSEYIPLLLAKVYAGIRSRVVNIVNGAGEIGSSSALAASGRFYESTTPAGTNVKPKALLAGMDGIQVIEITQRDPVTGNPRSKTEVWTGLVKTELKAHNVVVLLHILESSKLGYRLDEMEVIEDLSRHYSNRLLIVVDACQSRTGISRIRQYLKAGCMVMITGSKFVEGPPLSGAVIIPSNITSRLTSKDFKNFPSDLKNFVTRYDVSGPMSMIHQHLPLWMNWGLMLRWTLALDNWESYRKIAGEVRNRLVRGWVSNVLKMIKDYPEVEVLDGGGDQPGAVGDTNTIISIKLNEGGRPLKFDQLKKFYNWMAEDMSNSIGENTELPDGEKEILRRSFLVGQPVDVGPFGVLRISLGAQLVIRLNENDFERELADDRALLEKLSLLLKYHREIEKCTSIEEGLNDWVAGYPESTCCQFNTRQCISIETGSSDGAG